MRCCRKTRYQHNRKRRLVSDGGPIIIHKSIIRLFGLGSEVYDIGKLRPISSDKKIMKNCSRYGSESSIFPLL